MSEESTSANANSTTEPSAGKGAIKIVVLVLVAIAFAVVFVQFRDQLTLSAFAEREVSFREYQTDNPWLVFGIAFIAYVAATGLSLPGAVVLTLVIGWFFGFGRALLLVSFASTAGATLAFLLSRFLLRDTIERKFGDRMRSFNEALKREGAFYLFTLRLIPIVPFFVINLVMGLTPVRTTTFWIVSQVGMLPGTAVFVYAGASVPSLKALAEKGAGGILSPQLLVAFVLLGLFPLIARKLVNRFRPSTPASPAN
jgi:uncharacterized membrane protein YdjX (TVP38/TMEM64 family)